MHLKTNLVINSVVFCDVSTQGSDDDHCEDTSQEEDNNNRVDDWEPMDLYITHSEVRVPTRGPTDVTSLPLNLICEHQLGWTC